MNTRKLWIGFILVLVISFGILGYYGTEIYRKAPPIPEKFITPDGETVMTKQEIKDGQNVWQSMGGQEVGSIWGHGAYTAPDWTADWLHREALYILSHWAQQDFEQSYDNLNEENQAALQARLKKELRTNTYNAENDQIVISRLRAKVFTEIGKHYEGLFMDDPAKAHLREEYAIPAMSIKDVDRMDKMNAFFFWATWATVTERPGKEITYSNNWPPDKLVGNNPPVH
jgi:nitric oxide reductase subunit B